MTTRRWAGPDALLGDAGASGGAQIPAEGQAPLNQQAGGQSGAASAAPPPAGADINFEKLTLLFEVDPLARLAYSGKNTGLSDPSDSGQDLSLATRAAMAGWKDGELRALIAKARRDRNAGPKHPRYFELTAEKAVRAAQRQHSEGRVAEEFGLPEGTAVATLENPERLKLISTVLDLDPPVTRITKTMTDPEVWHIFWNGISVTLGTSASLLEHRTFQARILTLAGKVIPPMKRERWAPLVQMISDAAEVLEPGEEGHALGVARGWLNTYLADNIGDRPSPVWKELARGNRPFRNEAGVYLSTQGQSGFLAHIRMLYEGRFTSQQLAGTLRQLDWTYAPMSIRDDAGVFGRKLWKAPEGWVFQ